MSEEEQPLPLDKGVQDLLRIFGKVKEDATQEEMAAALETAREQHRRYQELASSIIGKLFILNMWIQNGMRQWGDNNVLLLHRGEHWIPLSAIELGSNLAITNKYRSVHPALTDEEVETLLQFSQYNLATRRLPGGQMLYVMPLLYGQAQLSLGALLPTPEWHEVGMSFHYETREQAYAAMRDWDPASQPEPTGWIYHPGTG